VLFITMFASAFASVVIGVLQARSTPHALYRIEVLA
jgi:hypothetical protein